MRKPHLIPNWKRCWRMYSVQADAIPLAIISAWAVLPAEWQDLLPAPWMLGVAVVSFALGIIGRVIQQPSLHRTTGAVEDKP